VAFLRAGSVWERGLEQVVGLGSSKVVIEVVEAT
jgi:hypothetical protein